MLIERISVRNFNLIFVRGRGVYPSPQPVAIGLTKQREDVLTVLKFIFSTQRNGF